MLAILVLAAGVAGVIRGTGRPMSPVAGPSRPEVPTLNPPRPQGSPAVTAFFASYVDSSGRVVRWDQDGDTVSEGQAYALLIAAATGDRSHFDTVWAWTSQHLQRLDGLLAWHWVGGRVVDWMPAADADLNTAWALSIAGERFADPSLDAAARRIASSILAEETVATTLGPVLVAGPWARADPALVEPGYFSPEAFATLERSTGDPRWAGVSSAAMVILGRLSRYGLPPDWASVTVSGAAAPIAAPGTYSAPSFGLDAARAIVWVAPCSGAGSAIATTAWARLTSSAARGLFPIKSTLGGTPETSDVNAAIGVADSAAAQAAGDLDQARSVLEAAARISARYPTYYGTAWVALANSLLTDGYLKNCSV